MPTPVTQPLWRLSLLAMAFGLLSACTLTQQATRPDDSSQYALTSGNEIATQEEDEEVAEDALDVFLSAPIYRSPDYTLSADVKPGRMARALETALSLQGTPYRNGGDLPEEGLDCSGFVNYSFSSVGIDLPRTSSDMYNATERVSRSELQPGDLLFFKTGRPSRSINHVAIYLGNGRFIHAPRRGRTVSIDTLEQDYWRERFIAGGRVGGMSHAPLELAAKEESQETPSSHGKDSLETAAAAAAPLLAAGVAPNKGGSSKAKPAKAAPSANRVVARNDKTRKTAAPTAQGRATPTVHTQTASRTPASRSPVGKNTVQTAKASGKPPAKPVVQAKNEKPAAAPHGVQAKAQAKDNDKAKSKAPTRVAQAGR